MKAAVVIALFVGFACADPSWNDLRVTFGINPFNTWNFDSLPRDLSGNMQSFEMMDNQCSTANAKFLGKRYWYEKDPATIILFDVNGYIAGIQSAVPKTSGWVPSPKMLGKWIIDDGTYYTLTVYFVDPRIICTGGRSADQYGSQGTGTGLYIQNGPNPLSGDVFHVPAAEDDAKKTRWGSGKCFYLMGMHYWYNVTKDLNCDDFVPYCLLYNDGVLNAFCFAISFDVEPSKRYEHPTPKAASGFMSPVPDCFYSDPAFKKLSTQHVYLTSNYLANRC